MDKRYTLTCVVCGRVLASPSVGLGKRQAADLLALAASLDWLVGRDVHGTEAVTCGPCDTSEPRYAVADTLPREPLKVHIRWMIRRDMPEVLAIERASFAYPWPEAQFTHHLRQRNVMGTVAEYGDKIVGYMMYELHKSHLHVLNFCVHPDWRRCGVGRQLMAYLCRKLSADRRRKVTLLVIEENLDAQKFFAAAGFVAVGMVRQPWDDVQQDGIAFEFVFKETENLKSLESM